MDYEKKYKEALKVAQKLYQDCPNGKNDRLYHTTDLEKMFPELKVKESEDEKIRKFLIKWIQDNYYHGTTEIPTKTLIAWLEKQGKSDKIVEKAKTEKQRILVTESNGSANIDWNTRSLEDARKLLECGLQYINTELEKQGEQKLNDEIEPKFKVGVWIVNNISKDVFLIKSINSGYCSLEDTKGNIYSPCLPLESDFHLWTIEDARPGDVLAIEWNQDNDVWEKILIFKALNDIGVEGYGNTFKNNNLFFIDENVPYYSKTWTKTLHPATNEQRDALFAKMKEAGYEWDFEKKELKKYTPIFTVGDTIIKKPVSDINFGYFTITDITGGKYWYNDRIICEINEQNDWELVKQKPAERESEKPKYEWSEDDNKRISRIYDFLWKHKRGFSAIIWQIEEDANWLKSLKDRGQPKQEWSEEDEEMFKSLKTLLNNASCHSCTEGVDKILSWIKSLKSQKQWKPSDEQMDALNCARWNAPFNIEILDSLYNDLKKLTE